MVKKSIKKLKNLALLAGLGLSSCGLFGTDQGTKGINLPYNSNTPSERSYTQPSLVNEPKQENNQNLEEFIKESRYKDSLNPNKQKNELSIDPLSFFDEKEGPLADYLSKENNLSNLYGEKITHIPFIEDNKDDFFKVPGEYLYDEDNLPIGELIKFLGKKAWGVVYDSSNPISNALRGIKESAESPLERIFGGDFDISGNLSRDGATVYIGFKRTF